MIQRIILPPLAQRMKEATVALWRVKIGERISRGQVLCEVIMDKVTLEVESPTEGILRHILAPEGYVVPVEEALAIVGDPDEAIPPEFFETSAYLPSPPPCDLPPEERASLEPLDAMRRIIAQRMVAAKQAPHFYLTTTVDMTAAYALRQRLKSQGIRATYTDMWIRASALALKKFPRACSLFTPCGYLRRDRIHIGFAVALEPEGLVVPVIRDADQKPLVQIAEESKSLIQKARSHRLTPDEYGMGVFTISNLASYEVDHFVAILNPGESAILAIGKTVDTPVVLDGTIVIRPLTQITLSSDHRTIDGVLAARINGEIKRWMEAPEGLC